MKRSVYSLKAGSMKNLVKKEETLLEPQGREAKIELKAIGLNFADVFAIWGLYSATPKGEFVPGLEFSGIVQAVGPDCSSLEVGDRVMGISRFGAYCTHMNQDERYLIKLKADWSFETGAAYLVQVLTAYYALFELGNLQKGANVLIHSAAGGVGILANRIAKTQGAYTLGTVGSPNKVDFCYKEGYDKVIQRNPKSFEKDLDAALGDRPLDLVMECIGGEIMKIGYKRLSPQGRTIIYGSAHYAQDRDKPSLLSLLAKYRKRPKIDPQQMIQLNKGILGFNLIYLYDRVELMHELLQKIEKLNIEAPVVGQTFAFEDLKEALKKFRSGSTIGKVVVTLS